MTRACKYVASLARIWLTPEVKNEEAKVAKRQQRVHKRKRFILVDREHGNVLGDTGYGWNGQPVARISGLYPVKAAAMLQSRGATDHYPYRYRTIRRSHPNAVFDADRAPPGFPRAAEGSPPDAVGTCVRIRRFARPHLSKVHHL